MMELVIVVCCIALAGVHLLYGGVTLLLAETPGAAAPGVVKLVAGLVIGAVWVTSDSVLVIGGVTLTVGIPTSLWAGSCGSAVWAD